MRTLFETVVMDGDKLWGHLRGVSYSRQGIAIEAQPLGKSEWRKVVDFAVVENRLAYCLYKSDVPIETGGIEDVDSK